MRRLALALAACVVLGVLALPGASWAGGERVAVLDFHGKGAERYEKRVRKIVRSRAKLISESKYRKTARKLHARSTRSRHIAKVADRLDLDAVITGKTVKRHGKRYLKIYVRSGDGKIVDKFLIPSKKKLSRKVKSSMKKRIRRALGDAGDAHERRARKMKKKRLAEKRRAKKRKNKKHLAKKRRAERRKKHLAKKRRAEERRERLAKERRAAKRKKRLAKERRARERREKKAIRMAKKRKAEKRRKAREREARRMTARAKAKYDSSGQAIDDEKPPGL